jgi:hypothetical protein
MGIGTGIFLIALGAILKFAVTDAIEGVNLSTVGVILMIVGIAGVILSLVWANTAARRGGGTVVRERDVV